MADSDYITLWGIILVTITFVLRYLIIFKSENNFDVFGHLYFVKQVKKKGRGPFTSIETRILESVEIEHPFLWHWFVGRLPIGLIIKYNRLLNPLLDSVYVLIIYFLTLKMGFSLEDASWVILLYLFSPLFFTKLNLGPRIFCTPRLFSEVLVNLFLILTILPLGINDELRILLGAICVFFVLGSSKFGLQAILFLTPLVCIFENNFVPLATSFAGLVGILVCSNFRFAKSVKEQLKHLAWYFKKNLTNETAVSRRNDFKRIFSFEKDKTLTNNFSRLIIRLVQDFSYSSIILKFPCFLLFFVFLIFCQNDETIRSLNIFAGPVLASAILFILVSLPLLLFLGEAERYISHASFFALLGTVVMAKSLSLEFILYILLIYGILYLLIEIFLLPDSRASRKYEDLKLLSFLQKQNFKINLILYPFHAIGIWRVLLQTPANVLFPFHNKHKLKKLIENRYCPEYPYTNLDHLEEMAAELGINMLVFDKKELSRKLPSWRIGENWNELDLGGKFYSVFSRKDFEVIL
tara:strand:+ start:9300 stop:10868 length:1569 start_codon:yes stop_codon:yes gene_type:complete